MKKRLRYIKWLFLAALIVATLALPVSAQAQDRTHIVQRGENLTRIAIRYGTTVQAIAQANGIGNPSHIYVGQRLRIPGGGGYSAPSGGSGGVHVVRRGETLSAIAYRYGTTIAAIAQANGIRNPSYIYAGQRLRIPGASAGSASSGYSAPSGGSGAVHVVRRGENLSAIAYRYGTTVAAISAANGIRNPSYIYAGQRLRIPGRSGGGATAPSGGGGAKWIDVDLSSQTVRAYQGNAAIRAMVVSTGISRYPTPPGRFSIYAKYPSVNMSGPGYYLPGVPHTMFFYRGYALHGTYWHSNFGTPMSHGCINLTRADAAWLYSWAPVGTSVVIHW